VTRASSGEPWSSAALVPVVNSATNDTAAFLSADGCELWFSSDRPGGVGGVDLYHTRRM